MRKYAKLIFVAMLTVLMVCSLVACGDNSAPSQPGGGSGTIDSNTPIGTPEYLTFEDSTQGSIFWHTKLSEFKLSDIKLVVNYEYMQNGKKITTKGKPIEVKLENVDESCRDLLKVAGNHMIIVNYTVDGVTVSGTFDLHLQNDYVDNNVPVVFDLAGGKNTFVGTTDKDTGKVSVNLKDGDTYTWGEFISKFGVFKTNMALSAWKYNGGTFNSTSSPITITSGMEFTAVWVASDINVSFDLNLPLKSGGQTNELISGEVVDGAILAAMQPQLQNLVKNNSFVPRPAVESVNQLKSYQFGGWFTDKACTHAWNFNALVGDESFTLYSKWVVRTYSLTFFLQGGDFKGSVTASPKTDKTSISSTNFTNNSIKYADGTDGIEHTPYQIFFSGIAYGTNAGDYTADVAYKKESTKTPPSTEFVSTTKSAILNPTTFAKDLEKGENGFYEVAYWYTESVDGNGNVTRTEFDFSQPIKQNDTLYAEWKIKAGATDADKNKYYVDTLYKDNLTVLSDGTLRIDLLKDVSVNAIEIPDQLTLSGDKPRFISEIAPGAFMNSQALRKLDMRKVSQLKNIGANAFEFCSILETIYFPGDIVDEATGNVTKADNKITYIGEQAFHGTAWENNQKSDTKTGLDAFIKINKTLYRYVGDMAATSIDMSGIDFDPYTSIAPKCFLDMPKLDTVKFNINLTTIHDGAFSADKKLANVSVASGSKLTYIGDNAFTGTAYVKSKAVGDTTDKRLDDLVLGDIYYRFIGNENQKNATIPATVKRIAARAFGSKAIEKIVFENAAVIESVGANAFTNTKWVTTSFGTEGSSLYITPDGFAVVNGILTNYTGRATSVLIPDKVTSIGESAFGAFGSANITHITIPASVKSIAERAFSGCSKLVAVTFSDYNAINTSDTRVKINASTFLDEKYMPLNKAVYNTDGTYRSGLAIYVSETSMEVISNPANDIPVWTELYNGGRGLVAFEKSIVVSIEIDPKLETNYLKTGSGWTLAGEWKDFYAEPDKVDGGRRLIDKLILHYNNGAVVHGNAYIDNVPNSSAGTQKLIFTDKNSNKTVEFTYNIYLAIDTAKPYDKTDATTIINGNAPDSPIFVDGLEKEYFLTNKKLDLSKATLNFKLINEAATGTPTGATPVSIMDSWVDGYSSMLGEHTLIITYSYQGFVTYKISYTYNTVQPSNEKVEQITSLAIPLNGNATQYLKTASVLVTMNDGLTKTVKLNSGDIKIISVDGKPATALITNAPGFHTAEITYNYLSYGKVECTILYSVIMEAEPENYTYNFDEATKTATITGINGQHQTVAILPYSVDHMVGTVNTTYTVVKISNDLFANDKALTAVVMPSTIKYIGDKAFVGCTNLKSVNSYEENVDTIYKNIDGTYKSIGDGAVRIIDENIEYIASRNISKLSDRAAKLAKITVPYKLDVKNEIVKTSDGTNSYVSSKIYHYNTITMSPTLFNTFRGEIRLLNNPENIAYAAANLVGKDVVFYNAGDLVATDSEFFVFDATQDKDISFTSTEQKLQLKAGAQIIVDTDATAKTYKTAFIPGIYKDENVLNTKGEIVGKNYFEIISFEDGAFNSLNSSLCETLFLPSSLIASNPYVALPTTGGYNIVINNVKTKTVMSPSLFFPKDLEVIGQKSFGGCTALVAVNFTKSTQLKTVGNYAFSGSGIKETSASVGVPKKDYLDLSKTALTEVGGFMFENCVGLVKIILPEAVKVINNGAFYQCYSLNSVVFVNAAGTDIKPVGGKYTHLTFIGEYAFKLCRNLTPFADVPKDSTAFEDCKIA
ncbi:MAG: leucine-rich repeat protein [Clostridia bacterium]